MVEKYIIDKTDIHRLLIGEDLALPQRCKARAFCVEVLGNLTNGDVIKAMFPNCEQKENIHNGYFEMYFDGDFGNPSYMTVSKGWWNAPYKKEEEECTKVQ